MYYYIVVPAIATKKLVYIVEPISSFESEKPLITSYIFRVRVQSESSHLDWEIARWNLDKVPTDSSPQPSHLSRSMDCGLPYLLCKV
jgi:hypothetical protein